MPKVKSFDRNRGRKSVCESVGYSAAGQIVGAELYSHSVPGKDADVIDPHFTGDVGKYLKAILKLDLEHGVGQGFQHVAEYFYTVALRH